MELRCLLNRSPFPMSSQRLLQMMAINMYSAYPAPGQPLIQEKAVQIILTMASLLLERVDLSLEKYVPTENSVVADDVVEILPTLKIWSDWMITCYCANDIPPYLIPQFSTGYEIFSIFHFMCLLTECMDLSCFRGKKDVFSLLADVLTRLEKIDLKAIELESKRIEGFDQIILPEDTLLAGFLPLYGAPDTSSFARSPFDKVKNLVMFP